MSKLLYVWISSSLTTNPNQTSKLLIVDGVLRIMATRQLLHWSMLTQKHMKYALNEDIFTQCNNNISLIQTCGPYRRDHRHKSTKNG